MLKGGEKPYNLSCNVATLAWDTIPLAIDTEIINQLNTSQSSLLYLPPDETNSERILIINSVVLLFVDLGTGFLVCIGFHCIVLMVCNQQSNNECEKRATKPPTSFYHFRNNAQW